MTPSSIAQQQASDANLNARIRLKQEDTAKVAYYTYCHRATSGNNTPWGSLQQREREGWLDVVIAVIDTVEDEPPTCEMCHEGLVCLGCDYEGTECPVCHADMVCAVCEEGAAEPPGLALVPAANIQSAPTEASGCRSK